MISKQDIIAAVRRIKKETSRRPRRLLHPDRDWFILLTAAIVLGSVCVVWSVFQFGRLQQEGYTPNVMTDKVPVYDREKAMEILNYQMSREAGRSNLAPIILEENAPAESPEEETESATESGDPVISG